MVRAPAHVRLAGDAPPRFPATNRLPVGGAWSLRFERLPRRLTSLRPSREDARAVRPGAPDTGNFSVDRVGGIGFCDVDLERADSDVTESGGGSKRDDPVDHEPNACGYLVNRVTRAGGLIQA